MLRPFTLHEPTTVAEAASLISRHGPEAALYAGGTELLLAMKSGVVRYGHLVNVKTIPGIDAIAFDNDAGTLTVGATATHRAIEASPVVRERFPLLADVERRVANVRVRNVGTLGGNLCFAEPHSDPGVALLLYEATAEVAGNLSPRSPLRERRGDGPTDVGARGEVTGPGGVRILPIDELIAGPYETSLEPGELLTRVIVPAMPEGMRAVYYKFGYHARPTLGLGVAARFADGTGVSRAVADVRIAVGSVSPKPVRVRDAEAALRGQALGDVLSDGAGASGPLAAAGEAAVRAAEPVTDLHGSAEYKAHLVRVFLRKALAALADHSLLPEGEG